MSCNGFGLGEMISGVPVHVQNNSHQLIVGGRRCFRRSGGCIAPHSLCTYISPDISLVYGGRNGGGGLCPLGLVLKGFRVA